MLDKIKNKFKNKKGAMITIVLLLIIPICFLVAILCDIGRYYIYKIEMQKMADSITTGVVQSSVDGYKNSYQGAKFDVVLNKDKALNKANDLYNINNKDLPVEITNKNISYNFNNPIRDISQISSNEQDILYKAGIFHVEFSAEYECFWAKFTGTDKIKILVDSTSQIDVANKDGLFAKKDSANRVKTDVDDYYIKVYDSKGNLYYSKKH